jgi:hypothetical protein
MKNLLLLTIFLLSIEKAIGQLHTPEHERSIDNELLMTNYEKDPEAEAVVLYDIGKSVFDKNTIGYFIRFTRKTRIKILKKEGISSSLIEVPLYKENDRTKEELISFEGNTYNLNNGIKTVRSIDKSKIFEEIVNDKWSVKKIALPDVSVGSVIEYTYTVDIPFLLNLPDWQFQNAFPTIYSEYTVSMIPSFEYIYLLKGADKFDYQNSYIEKTPVGKFHSNQVYNRNTALDFDLKVLVHNYVMKNIPAFKDEGYLYNTKDHIISIDFQLAKINFSSGLSQNIMSTWPELSKDLLKHDNFGDYIKDTKSYAKKILETEIKFKDLSENGKLKTIIQYTKENFTWNGNKSIYADKSAKDFLKNKVGNVANINLFLLTLLKEAGIDAQPIILSTRNNGRIYYDYPFISFFNYVVILVNSSSPFVTDATDLYLPYYRIPLQCQHESGLIVSELVEEWVNLENKSLSDLTYLINMEIDSENNKLIKKIDIMASEYEAKTLKFLFKNDTLSIKEHYKTIDFNDIINLKTKNFDDPTKPYVISFIGFSELEYLGNNYILNPFNNLYPKENNLTKIPRKYPLDFDFPKSEKYKIKLKIPTGYRVNQIPKDYSTSDELAEIKITYYLEDSNLSVSAYYALKKQRYQSSEYLIISSHIDTLTKMLNEQLILTKN